MKRAWYLVCAVPFVSTSLIAAIVFAGLVGQVEGMQRGLVPGAVQVSLAPGEYALYAETRSKLAGVVYAADSYSLRCTLATAAGTAVPLEAPGATATYSFGDYTGSSLHNFSVAARGAYQLACQSETTPRIVVAVGPRIGNKLVTMIVLVFAGGVASLLGFILMHRRRKAWLAAQRTSS